MKYTSYTDVEQAPAVKATVDKVAQEPGFEELRDWISQWQTWLRMTDPGDERTLRETAHRAKNWDRVEPWAGKPTDQYKVYGLGMRAQLPSGQYAYRGGRGERVPIQDVLNDAVWTASQVATGLDPKKRLGPSALREREEFAEFLSRHRYGPKGQQREAGKSLTGRQAVPDVGRACKGGLIFHTRERTEKIDIYFDLSGIDFHKVVTARSEDERKRAKGAITGQEVRSLYRQYLRHLEGRSEVDFTRIHFTFLGHEVEPPWQADPELWALYQPRFTKSPAPPSGRVPDELVGVTSVTEELVERLIQEDAEAALMTLYTSDRFMPLGPKWTHAAWVAIQQWYVERAIQRLPWPRQHHAPAADAAGLVRSVLRAPGAPLDSGVCAAAESFFGADFSQVRVHTDTAAGRSADALSAQAYTSGSNIVFAAGMYDPSSPAGRRRLGHELAHVTQQRRGAVTGTPHAGGLSVSDPADRFEQAADRIGSAFAAGGPAPVYRPAGAGSAASPGPVQRVFATLDDVQVPAQAGNPVPADRINREFNKLNSSPYVNMLYPRSVWSPDREKRFWVPIITDVNNHVDGTPADAGWVLLNKQGEIKEFRDNAGNPFVQTIRRLAQADVTIRETEYHQTEMHGKVPRNLRGKEVVRGEIAKKGSIAVPYRGTRNRWVNLTNVAGATFNVRIDIEMFHDRPTGLGRWQRIKIQPAGGQIGGWLLWCGPEDGPLIEYSADILANSFDQVLSHQGYLLVYPTGDQQVALPT